MVDFECRALYGSPEEEAASAELVVSCIVRAQPNVVTEPKLFLDLFCGNGLFLQRINTLMPQWDLHAIDRDQNILAQVTRNCPQAKLTHACCPPIAYPDNFFDLVCTKKIMDYADIRYLRQPARQQVFGDSFHLEGLVTEISRILKPGGMYYVFDNLREPEHTILKQANLHCVTEDYLWKVTSII